MSTGEVGKSLPYELKDATDRSVRYRVDPLLGSSARVKVGLKVRGDRGGTSHWTTDG